MVECVLRRSNISRSRGIRPITSSIQATAVVDGPRYSFHPLERRGVLLGLDASQLLLVAGSGVLALLVHSALGGRAGVGLGGAVLAGGIVAGVWRRDGTPLALRTWAGMRWLARRSGGASLDDIPLRGRPLHSSPVSSMKNSPKGIELVEDCGARDENPVGVVRDRRAGTWAAVIPVRGHSFSLRDPDDQARTLEGWRQVLGATARPDTPVIRLQWLQRSGPRQSCSPTTPTTPTTPTLADPAGPVAHPDAAASYRQLVQSAYPSLT